MGVLNKSKEKSMKVKLQDIVVDPTIQVRNVESHTVSTYTAAMRAGAKFPPLLLEEKTNRLVCGNHRYYAYETVMEPDQKVDCEIRRFSGEAEIIRTAARDNSTHGRPLDTFDRKRITQKLQALGDSMEDIAGLLNVPVSKVENWSGMKVIVVGKKGKSIYRHEEPLKHGLEHLAGKEVTEEQYTTHKTNDRGVPISGQAMTIARWIDNGWIDEDNERIMQALESLYNSLADFFKNRRKSA